MPCSPPASPASRPLRGAAVVWLCSGLAARADAPLLTRQPVDQRAFAGEKVRLAAGASSPLPMTYTWRKDGQPLAGATQSFLDLDNAQPADSGSYELRAHNADGFAATRLCHVRILLPELRPGIADTAFFAGTISQGDVLALAADGTDCWLGGDFGTVNGQSRPYLARLNAAGGPADGFSPGTGPNGQVNAIAPQGNGVLIGGEFTACNGRPAPGLVRLDHHSFHILYLD